MNIRSHAYENARRKAREPLSEAASSIEATADGDTAPHENNNRSVAHKQPWSGHLHPGGGILSDRVAHVGLPSREAYRSL